MENKMGRLYFDYPSEPIGGGNPYQCCSACGKSAPAINGELEGHYEWCEWRKKMEAKIDAQGPVDVTVSRPDCRQIHAKADKQCGRRAYSDTFGHVLIRLGGAEHGLELACAIRLREDLDRAIHNAALSDADYLNKCRR